MGEFKLCYVSGSWAYFTTRDIEDQWGDDWNDASYEHNAGYPYTYQEHNQKRGEEPWEITKVAFDGPFEIPGSYTANSMYSVQMINRLATPWVSTDRFSVGHKGVSPVSIWAGCTIPDFIRLVKEGGGTVYLEVKDG